MTDDIDEIMNIEELQIQDLPDNNENEMDEFDVHLHLVVDDVVSVDDVAANYLFSKATDHTQMSARAGIKKLVLKPYQQC